MSEAKILRRAFLSYVQLESEYCAKTGEPCRNPDQCGCWLEMVLFIDEARDAVGNAQEPNR